VIINGYSICGYWWLLMVIVFVAIGEYFIGGYWWLLMIIILMAIVEYYIILIVIVL
jgi:hypothetical protein